MCGTVYGDMQLKDLLGSIVRVGYRIPVPDFYLVLHGLLCQKSAIMDLIKPNQTFILRTSLKRSKICNMNCCKRGDLTSSSECIGKCVAFVNI